MPRPKTMSKFIDQAQTGENKWWQYVATILILFISIALTGLLVNKVIFPALLENGFQKSLMFNQVLQYVGISFMGLLGIFVLYLTVTRLHKRSFASLNYLKSFSLKELFEGAAICAVFLAISSAIFDFSSFAHFDFSVVNYALLTIVPLVIIAVTIQSYFEELLFRGYILQGLSLKIKNKYVLFTLIGVLFSLIHLGVGANLQALLETFSVGFVLSFIVFKRENLFFVTGIHTVNNIYSLYLISVFNQEKLPASAGTLIEWKSFLITVFMLALIFFYVVLKEKLFTIKNT